MRGLTLVHLTSCDERSMQTTARLVDGFHAFEASDAIRWTDGDAAVPAALFDGMTDSAVLVAAARRGRRNTSMKARQVA